MATPLTDLFKRTQAVRDTAIKTRARDIATVNTVVDAIMTGTDVDKLQGDMYCKFHTIERGRRCDRFIYRFHWIYDALTEIPNETITKALLHPAFRRIIANRFEPYDIFPVIGLRDPEKPALIFYNN